MRAARQNVVTGWGAGHETPSSLLSRAPSGREASRPSTPGIADRVLLDEIERAQRRGSAADALILRLSRLSPALAKPHHRRVARVLLDDAALRRGGQVFALRNGDLVLLGPNAGASRPLLERLFGADDGIVQTLALGAELTTYAEERASDPPAPPAPAAEAPAPSGLGAAEALIAETDPGDLLQLQVAAELLPGGALRPSFREISARVPALVARLSGRDGVGASATPFLDLASQLDARVLSILCANLGGNGPLSVAGRGALALHLNLTASCVLSRPFDQFAAAIRARGGRAAVELSLLEACADPPGFMSARDHARAHGISVVLDGVDVQALLLTQPAGLRADIVKLEWSDGLATAPGAAAAVQAIGPADVVLTRADSEEALRWGYGLGIRRFQGAHMDAMLAAARLGACAFASGCSIRLCSERASATSAAGRAGCRNLSLLDAAR